MSNENKGREISQKEYQMFKDGKLNTRCPHDYNYLLGYSIPTTPKATAVKRLVINYSFAKVNGQHISAYDD